MPSRVRPPPRTHAPPFARLPAIATIRTMPRWWIALPLSLLAPLASGQDPARAGYDEAAELVRTGKAPEAIALLDRALAEHPDAAMLWWQRAYAKGAVGDFPGGIQDASKAIELAPRTATAWRERGRQRLWNGDYASAVSDLERASKLDPGDAFTHRYRGDARLALLDPLGARADYESALAEDPESIAALDGHARACCELCDWATALRDYRRTTRRQPTEVVPWLRRAHAEAQLGQWPAAHQSMRRALALATPEHALELHQMAAEYLVRSGDVAAARTLLESVAATAKQGPAPPVIVYERAMLALMAGDLSEARAGFDRVLATSPELATWAALMKWCCWPAAEQAAANAALCADGATLPRPHEPLAAELLALCAEGVGDSDGMPLAGRDTTARCPLWFFAGLRAARAGRDEDARRHLRRCLNTGRVDYLQWRVASVRWRTLPGGGELAPSLAMTVEAVPDQKPPLLVVTALAADGAAAIQGVQLGDRLRMVNHEPATATTFAALTRNLVVGTRVRFLVQRGEQVLPLVVTTGIAAP